MEKHVCPSVNLSGRMRVLWLLCECHLEGEWAFMATRLPDQVVTTQNRAQGDVLGVGGGTWMAQSEPCPIAQHCLQSSVMGEVGL